jgi:hypothetical protein
MNPGMDEGNRKEREFTKGVDDVLAGKEVKAGEPVDQEYRLNIDFAKKIMECRGEPSLSFQEGLKKRLLSNLAEQEAAKVRQGSEAAPFWDRLRALMPQRPAWRTVAVTATVAALVLLVVCSFGLFSPGKGPVLTGPGPTVSVETRASNIKPAYTKGEEVAIQFSFNNVTDKTLKFVFPPEIRIENSNVEAVRTFAGGNATMTLGPGQIELYNFTWDQKDQDGKQVPLGDYQIVMPNIPLGEGEGVVQLIQAPTITILSEPP